MTPTLPSRALEWTNLILGASLFCTAFMFGDFPVASLSAALVGLAVVTCSTIALNRYKLGAEWSNFGLGIWAIIAPFLLGFGSQQSPVSTHIFIGFCVATIATMQLVGGRNASAVAVRK